MRIRPRLAHGRVLPALHLPDDVMGHLSPVSRGALPYPMLHLSSDILHQWHTSS